MLRADARHIFGADGLCGAHFPFAELHHQRPSVKVICDEVQASPGRSDDRGAGAALEHCRRTAAAARPGDADRALDHSGRHARRPGQRDAGGRVQHLLRRRGGPRRVPLAGHQDADSDRRHQPHPVRLRHAAEDSGRRIADGAAAAEDCCRARFVPIGSTWAWKGSTCTTRWRWSPRCSRNCSRRSGCTATWKPTARSRTGRRCSIAGGIRRAGRIWTWRCDCDAETRWRMCI